MRQLWPGSLITTLPGTVHVRPSLGSKNLLYSSSNSRMHRRLAPRQELSKKTLQGSADMRIWVVQREDPGMTSTGSSFPSAPSSPAKLLHNLSSTLDADCSTKLGPTKKVRQPQLLCKRCIIQNFMILYWYKLISSTLPRSTI